MLGPLAHVGAGLAYLATARRQHTSDQLTAQQLAWSSDRALPPGLSLTWFGTAGFRLEYQGTVLWIDPYVTRHSIKDMLFRRVVATDDNLVTQYVDRADAVLVGHTHFDHAMDVPAIARAHGAKVFGSASMRNLMGLYGLADQTTTVEPHRDYEVGPFRFHFVPSIHSKLQLGLGIPYSGELTCEHLDDLIPQAYKCGDVYGIWIEVAGIRFYHQGSADLIESEIKDRDVDIFLCGASGRRFTPNYLTRIVNILRPQLIVPTHYDNFFKPLALGTDTKFSFNVNLTGFADEARVASREVPLACLSVGVPVGSASS